jgi:hypothetical protein
MHPKNQCLDQQSIEIGHPPPLLVPELIPQPGFYSADVVEWTDSPRCFVALRKMAELRWKLFLSKETWISVFDVKNKCLGGTDGRFGEQAIYTATSKLTQILMQTFLNTTAPGLRFKVRSIW